MTDEIEPDGASLGAELDFYARRYNSLTQIEMRVRKLLASIPEKVEKFNEGERSFSIDAGQLVVNWNPLCTFNRVDITVHIVVRKAERRAGSASEVDMEKARKELELFLTEAMAVKAGQLRVAFNPNCLEYQPKKYEKKKRGGGKSAACAQSPPCEGQTI